MKWFARCIVLIALVVSSATCMGVHQRENERRLETAAATALDPNGICRLGREQFQVIVQTQCGKIVAQKMFPGELHSKLVTKPMRDGSALVIGITDPEMFRILDQYLLMLNDEGSLTVNLATALAGRLVSCHYAEGRAPSSGIMYGPYRFECENLLVIGATTLDPKLPIWDQRCVFADTFVQEIHPD